MDKLIALLTLALLGTACSPGVSVYIRDSEPDALIEETQESVDFWNDAIGIDLLQLKVTHPSLAGIDPMSIVIASVNKTGSGDDVAHTYSQGIIVRVIRVEDDWIEDGAPLRLRRTLCHELGHALGLEHESTPDNLMHHGQEEGADIWRLTDAQKRRVRSLTAVSSMF